MSDYPHVIFIHGRFRTGRSWEPWIEHPPAVRSEKTAPLTLRHHALRCSCSPDSSITSFHLRLTAQTLTTTNNQSRQQTSKSSRGERTFCADNRGWEEVADTALQWLKRKS